MRNSDIYDRSSLNYYKFHDDVEGSKFDIEEKDAHMLVETILQKENDIHPITAKERAHYVKFFEALKEEEKPPKGNESEINIQEKIDQNQEKIDQNQEKLDKMRDNEEKHVRGVTNITKNFLFGPVMILGETKTNKVKCAQMNPDHSQVYLGIDKTIIRYCLKSETKSTLGTFSSQILSKSISKCGKLLIAGGNNAGAWLINIETSSNSDPENCDRKDLSFKDSNKSIRVVKFSLDDEDAMIGRDDGYLFIYKNVKQKVQNDLTDLTPEIEVLLHSDGLCSMAACQNSKILATGGNDKKIKLLDYSQPNLVSLVTISNHIGIVRALTFSVDGSLLLSGSYDKTAKLFKSSTGEELMTYMGHNDRVLAVAMSPDTKLVLTGGEGSHSILYDRVTGEIIAKYDAEGIIRVVLFIGIGSHILIAGEDSNTIGKIYSINPGRKVFRHSRHGDFDEGNEEIWSIDIFKNKIITGGGDSSVRIYELETGWEIIRFLGHVGPVFSVSFSENGRKALSCGDDFTVRIYDVINGILLKCFRDHSEYVNVAKFNWNAHEIITAGMDEKIIIYDSFTGDKLFILPSKHAKIERMEKTKKGENHEEDMQARIFSSKRQTLDVVEKQLKDGQIYCLLSFQNKYKGDETIIISGGSKYDDNSKSFSMINVYKYSREEGAENIRKFNLTYDTTVVNLSINIERNFLFANIEKEIRIYDLDILINPEASSEKLIATINLEEDVAIKNFSILDRYDDEKKISFIALQSFKVDEVDRVKIEQFDFCMDSESKIRLVKEFLNEETKEGENEVITFKLVKNQTQILYGGKDGVPKIIDISKNDFEPFSDCSLQIEAICISDKELAYINEKSQIRITDVFTGELKHAISFNNNQSFDNEQFYNLPFDLRLIEFIKLGELLIVCNKYNNIRILHYLTGTISVYPFRKNRTIKTISYITKNDIHHLIFAGTEDGEIYMWDTETRDDPIDLYIPDIFMKRSVIALAPFFIDDTYDLYICFDDASIVKIINVCSQEPRSLFLLEGLDSVLTCASYNVKQTQSMSHIHLITGGEDKIVRVLKLNTLKEKIFKGHAAAICAVGLFMENTHAVSASKDRVVKVFEIDSGSEIYTFSNENPIYTICVSPKYDTIFFGTSCGLKIVERVLNSTSKLKRFVEKFEKLNDEENFSLDNYELNPDDLSLAPFPMNISFLNLASMVKKIDMLDLISDTARIIKGFEKERAKILLYSIFRDDEKFSKSCWDRWILPAEEVQNNHNKIYGYLIDIITSSQEISIEKMKNKGKFIKKVAETFPGRLLQIFNAFWVESDDINLPLYKISEGFSNFITSISRLLGFKTNYTYNGSKEFPIYLVTETSSPSQRLLIQQYNQFITDNQFKNKPNKYSRNTKLSLSLISLSELLDFNYEKEKISLSLSILERFEPDHSIFRSELLDTVVTYLWNIDCFIGYKFYQKLALHIIFLICISLNILFFVPFRENNRVLFPEQFSMYKTLSVVSDFGCITVCTLRIIFKIYNVCRLYAFRQHVHKQNKKHTFYRWVMKTQSKWALIDFLTHTLGIMASSFDITWANEEYILSETNASEFRANADLGRPWEDKHNTIRWMFAIFYFLAWFKSIEYARGIKSTSSLMRILLKVTMDMVPFFLVILFMHIGVSFTCYVLQSSYRGPNPMEFLKIVFFVIIGDYNDFNNLRYELNEEIFFLALIVITVFVVIFMLNLLIAIISDSFSEVRAKESQNEIYQKIQILNRKFSETTQAGRDEILKTIRGKYIFKLEKIIDEENEENIDNMNRRKIEKIENKIDEMNLVINAKLEEQAFNTVDINSKFQTLEKGIKELLKDNIRRRTLRQELNK